MTTRPNPRKVEVPLYVEIGRRLRWAREVHGSTQAELAEALGINRGSFSSMEGGKKPPTLRQAMELTRWLQVSLEYLLRGILTNADDQAIALELMQAHPAELRIAGPLRTRDESNPGI